MVRLVRLLRRCEFWIALACAFLPLTANAHQGDARVLYSFCSQANCADGSLPSGPLIADRAGNLYGETQYGGGGSCGLGCGTVFKITPDGTETVVYQFCSQANCADGAYPSGGLAADAKGNLYGTTYFGGVGCAPESPCPGTVFKITPDGAERVIHSFCAGRASFPDSLCKDGMYPASGVMLGADGNLYGATTAGGEAEHPSGAVFEIAADGKERVVYSFCQKSNCEDGAVPTGALLQDAQGNLFGTAGGGNGNYCHSSGCGTVYRIDATGSETVLHAFCTTAGCPDGYLPVGNLIVDKRGNLFGVTKRGGNSLCYDDAGCGTIFEVSPDSNESVIYAFCPTINCTDGYFPYAGLVADNHGNFYTTTSFGGGTGCGGTGCGAAVKFAPNGILSVLATFGGPPSGGAFPQASLIVGGSGQLYGTTNMGGSGTGCGALSGCGAVFTLDR